MQITFLHRMSESRTELIAWYNDLSGQSYAKIEQFGCGAAHCLIMDSIYRDVPPCSCRFRSQRSSSKQSMSTNTSAISRSCRACLTNTRLTMRFPSSDSSSANSRTIWSFCSGPRSFGISTIPVYNCLLRGKLRFQSPPQRKCRYIERNPSQEEEG